MRITYFILLAFSAILSIPFLGLLSAYLIAAITINPWPILFMPTLTLVLLGLLPLVLLWRTPSRRWLGLLIAPILPLAVLVLPPALAQPQQQTMLQDIPRQNATPIDTTQIKGVEIQRAVTPNPTMPRGQLFSRNLCGDICEQLLLGGAIDWVRVIPVNDSISRVPIRTSALFRRADAPACQALNPDMPDNTPCILYQNDAPDPAQLLITINEGTTHEARFWRDTNIGGLRRRGIRLVQAILPSQSEPQTLFIQSQLFYQTPQPMIISGTGQRADGQIGPGWFYVRETRNTADIDLAGQIATLGLTLAPPRTGKTTEPEQPTPPKPWLTTQIISLMNTDPAGDASSNNFADAKLGQIDSWLSRANTLQTFSPSQTRLLCRLQTDPRTQRLSWPPQLRTNITPACEG